MTRAGRALAAIAPVPLVLALALLALAGLLAAGGYDAPRALLALWEGAFGSAYAIHSGTLVRATPLVLAGLAVMVAFRAGILNIGAEGQLLVGAAAAAAVGGAAAHALGWATPVAALLAAAVAGAA